jgi:multiple sugar transport system permease protein
MADVAVKTSQVQRLSLGDRIARFIKKYGWGYAFVLPSMITFTIFILAPVVWSFIISFQDFRLKGDSQWVGLDNYAAAFSTQNTSFSFFGLQLEGGIFLQALFNTLYYTVITVTANIFIGLALSAMIQPLGKYAQTFFRAAYYLPAVTSAVIIAMVWRWMFNTQWGFLNFLLGLIGQGPVKWLSDPDIALNSITLSTILTVPATAVVLFSAAMASIPKDFYEAAELEGANPIRKWWSITLPLIKGTTLYLVVLYTIASFEVFEKIYILSPSGVGNSTQTIVTQIYQNGFQQFRYGVAAAQAFVLFLIIASVAAVQFRFFKTDVEY